MGGMLAHIQDKEIVSAFLQKFNDAQLEYSVREQKRLAGYEACKHFRSIIYGCNVMIKCDHMNINRHRT